MCALCDRVAELDLDSLCADCARAEQARYAALRERARQRRDDPRDDPPDSTATLGLTEGERS